MSYEASSAFAYVTKNTYRTLGKYVRVISLIHFSPPWPLSCQRHNVYESLSRHSSFPCFLVALVFFICHLFILKVRYGLFGPSSLLPHPPHTHTLPDPCWIRNVWMMTITCSKLDPLFLQSLCSKREWSLSMGFSAGHTKEASGAQAGPIQAGTDTQWSCNSARTLQG